MTDLTLSGNSAEEGGGGISNAGGNVTLTDSTLSENTAPSGGGIYNSEGMLTIWDSTISDNSVEENGGGIYCRRGTVTLTGGTMSGNSSTLGGGIYNEDVLTIVDLVISGNTAWDSGGGIFNLGSFIHSATLTIEDSTIFDNTALGTGGGVYNNASIAVIMGTNISGNSATWGGGINNYQGSVTMTQTILSGNSAEEGGGGISNASTGFVDIKDATFSGNTAPLGGGLYVQGTLTLDNTIIANNSSDLYQDTGMISGSNNLIGDGTGQTALTNGNSGNIVGTSENSIDPKFVNMEEDDWKTWDLHLATGSPAINTGNNDLAFYAHTAGYPLLYDLDGNTRIADGIVDMGVYEYGGIPARPPAMPGNFRCTDKTLHSGTRSRILSVAV